MSHSSARAVVDVGSVIADTYTIEGLIGRGGMGTVFVASHNRLPGKRVAIKLLHTEHQDEEILARFRREALIASQLDHPNIVSVHDFNVMPDGAPYLVLELLQGESLADRLEHDGALPLEEVFTILRQVGSAIAAAHQHGIVHRDLKPQNIFLVPVEAEGRLVQIAKVLDFGISKIRGSSTVKTQESSLLGTPQYMAPEQATGQHAQVDERTDVFALGAIAYEMLAGRPAFSGASIPEVVFKVVYEPPPPLATLAPDAPANVIAAIMKAMAKPSADRFATVSDFVEALTGAPIAARPSMAAVPLAEGELASGSRIRPPSTGRGRSNVGRSGVPVGGARTPSQSGREPTIAVGAAASSTQRGADPADAALASTMDPAAHAKVQRPPSLRVVSADAQTVDSIAPSDGTRPPAVPLQVPARKAPAALFVAMAAATLVVIAVCVFLVVRGGGEQGTAQPEPLAGGALPVALVDAAVVAADAVVDAVPVDATPAADATVAKPPPADAKPPVQTTGGSTTPRAPLSDEEKQAKERIERAEAALARNTEDGNAEARRLSNAVVDADIKRFVQRALAVQGVLSCRRHLPLDAKRLLPRVRERRARALLIRGCKQTGADLHQ